MRASNNFKIFKGKPVTFSSNFNGVDFVNATKKWRARSSKVKGHRVLLGFYDTEVEAAKAADDHNSAFNPEKVNFRKCISFLLC